MPSLTPWTRYLEAQCSSSSFSGSLSLIGGYWYLFPITNMTTHKISFSLRAQLVKNPPAMHEILVQFLVRKICLRRDRLPTPVFLGLPCVLTGKEPACNVKDLGLIPGLGRSPGEGKGYPWRFPWAVYSMGSQSRTRLSDFHFCMHIIALSEICESV